MASDNTILLIRSYRAVHLFNLISSTTVWWGVGGGGGGGGDSGVDTGNLSIFVCHVFGSFLKAYSSRSYVTFAYE